MSPQAEALGSAEELVREQLPLLRSVEESWQPADLLPDPASAGWEEEVRALRSAAGGLTDDVLVVLVGNLVTEEALPSYQTWLNRPEGMSDPTGASDNPWALWTRAWTAEENRHGDLLNRYLYLTGRVDVRAVEMTVQHLIRNGFVTGSDQDPYKALVYVSFQERATKIAHANVGRAAQRCGEPVLARICAAIAADEARHEEAYQRMFARVMEADPERALVAFAAMMRSKVAMPARAMDDGSGRDVFADFALVAQRSRVYTALDYAEIIEHLVSRWKVAALPVLGDAAAAQEYVCGLAASYRSKAERLQETAERLPKAPFRWLYGREV